MSQANEFDGIRAGALAQAERSERNYKAAFACAAAVEALFIAGFLLLADFKGNRTHLLLLLSTLAGYTVVAFGLLALGAHTTRNTLRILKAVELLERRLAGDGRST